MLIAPEVSMHPTFLLAILGCAALACHSAPAKLSEADIAAIRASADSFGVNAVGGRAAANAALFAENGVFMPPNQPAVEGRAAIEAWFAAFPKISEFKHQIVTLDGLGDI